MPNEFDFSMANIAMWVEALATCAIEGNEWAAETLELQKSNPTEFRRRLVGLEWEEQHGEV